MNTRKTAFGIAGAALATGIILTGAPAMASGWDDGGHTSYTKESRSYSGHAFEHIFVKDLVGDIHAPVVVAPEVDTGDIGSGNLSGNHTQAPILSGNETAVGSGNETNIGNGNAVGNVSDVANGNHVGSGNSADVSDTFDSTVGDIATDVTTDVSHILNDVDVSLKGIFD